MVLLSFFLHLLSKKKHPMAKYELNQLDVKKDEIIVLYQRPRKDSSIIPTWQMRISVPNSTGYKRVSTGEREQPEVIRKAINTYEKLYMKVLSAEALQSKSFKDVYNKWKVDLPKLLVGKNRTKDYSTERISTVGNFSLKFFKDLRLMISKRRLLHSIESGEMRTPQS